MTSLLCNSYNCRASSSSHKLKFAGALPFVIVIYSKQTAGEGEGFTKGDEDSLVDLSGGVDIHSAEEQYHSDDREGCGGDELYE